MADENVGLDLASQTGQEDIKNAIDGLRTEGLANQEGQEAISNAVGLVASQLATALHGIVLKTTNASIGTLTVTENGTYDAKDDADYDAYEEVVVDVPNTYETTDEGKVVSNGSLVSQSSQSISANGTYDTTENNEVVVSVPNTYETTDEGKVVSSGELVAQTSRNVTENGTYDTTLNNEVIVNVSGGDGGGGAKNILYGTNHPTSNIGNNGDIYLVTGVFPIGENKYIRSSGTQWINTLYTAKDNTRFEMIANVESAASYGVIFGARSGTGISASDRICAIYAKENRSARPRCAWATELKEILLQNNVMYNQKARYILEKTKVEIETEDGNKSAMTIFGGSASDIYPIFLFTLNNVGNEYGVDTRCTMKLYAFRVYESDNLVLELLPYVDGNNVACLKDTISGDFFYNQGTGDFTYGEDI